MFDKDSALVKVWVRLIQKENSKYTLESVPDISNLKIIVAELL